MQLHGKKESGGKPMIDTLERFLDPAFTYDFEQGPAKVRSIEDAYRDGINCVSLAHLALQDLFHAELPPDLHCAEMYADTERFEPVTGTDEMRQGDLVWFGINNAPILPEQFQPVYQSGQLINWREFPVKHVTVFTGDRDAQNDPLLLHSTYIAGTNVVWPLGRFADYARYQKLYKITRLAAAKQSKAA
jgi:hypothetical protein